MRYDAPRSPIASQDGFLASQPTGLHDPRVVKLLIRPAVTNDTEGVPVVDLNDLGTPHPSLDGEFTTGLMPWPHRSRLKAGWLQHGTKDLVACLHHRLGGHQHRLSHLEHSRRGSEGGQQPTRSTALALTPLPLPTTQRVESAGARSRPRATNR